MAGNMWEWTTETGRRNIEDGSYFDVLRGGCFSVDGIGNPLCLRYGNAGTYSNFSIGFRVVLYLQ